MNRKKRLKEELGYLIQSRDLWEWLRDNYLKHKFDYPLYDKIKNYKGKCPCCEYYLIIKNKTCRSCPIDYCRNYKSTYAQWCSSDITNSKVLWDKSTSKIVELLEKRITKIYSKLYRKSIFKRIFGE